MSKRAQRLPALKVASAALTPEQYRQTLDGVTLEALELDSVTASVSRELLAHNNPLHLRVDTEPWLQYMSATQTELLYTCTIKGLVGRAAAVRIRATYRIVLASKTPLSQEFAAIYAGVSGAPLVWPYLRELAHSLTSRMGVPELVLPLLKRG